MVSFEIVDVFTDRAYAGNPLAVVFDATALNDEQMQHIATEFNLSETAFVLPPTTDAAGYRVRIFTPAQELPYAGHPSVGTAVTLARRGELAPGETVQECGAGLLPIVIEDDFATLTGGEPSVGEVIDAEPLLATAGLRRDDLAGRPRRAGTGLEFNYLPVRPEAVARAVSQAQADEVYVFSFDTEAKRAHSRLFATELGVHEDPATGSAALGLGVYLVAEGLVPGDTSTSYVVKQGAEIGRPSQLNCMVDARSGSARRVTVRGQVVPVSRGEIVTLP